MVVLLSACQVYALDLLAGASLRFLSVDIYDTRHDMKAATFQSERFALTPALSLRTKARYFWEHSNWSYTFSADFLTSRLDKQLVARDNGSGERLADVDTRMQGWSLFLTPLLYYQFNRDTPDTWQYRAGCGAGVGFQEYRGDFLVTNAEHPDVGTRQTLRHSALGMSAGLYLEARYGNHHFIFNGDLLSTAPSGYMYLQNSVRLSYQYRLVSFSGFFE